MGVEPEQREEKIFDDELGTMIHQSLQSRVGRMAPPPRGREQLLAAARKQQPDHQEHRHSGREEFRWQPPQRRDQSHSDHDVFSALIHARDSVRRMSL